MPEISRRLTCDYQKDLILRDIGECVIDCRVFAAEIHGYQSVTKFV